MSQEDQNLDRELSFRSSSFDRDEYAKVANSARLVELGLTSQEYSAKLQCFWEASSENKQLKHAFSGEPEGCSFDTEQGVLAGGYEWTAEIRYGRKKALKLKATYLVVYTGLEGQNEGYCKLYFSKVARFATYPYFRAAFALNTSNSGISLDPLPSLIDRID